MILIGLTALARAGKDSVADYLVEKHHFEKLVFSDMLKDKAREMKLDPEDRMNLSIAGDELRKQYGNSAVGVLISKKINPNKDTVLSGVRSPGEVEVLKQKFPNFILVEVYSSAKVRFERAQKSTGETSFEEFSARDERDIRNKGMDKVLELADYRITNESTKQELYKNVDKLVEKLKKEN